MKVTSAISIKIALDIVWIVVIGCTLYWPVFIYEDDFEIGALLITYNFHSHGLKAYVQSKYPNFDDHLCKSSIDDTKSVCKRLKRFQTAGIIFTVANGFGVTIVVYGILNLIGKISNITARGCLHMDFTHYLNPFLNLLSLGIYCLEANLYVISYSVHVGLLTMFFSVFISLFNLIFYCCHKKMINKVADEYVRSLVQSKLVKEEDKELEISTNSVIGK